MKQAWQILAASMVLGAGVSWGQGTDQATVEPVVVPSAQPAETVPPAKMTRMKAETAEEFDERMRWWRDARFGLFIHFGLYAIPAGEWEGQTKYAEWIRHRARIPKDTYHGLLEEFNPAMFNAADWVTRASEAGMKYLVITAKHHDGFCLWPSEVTEFDMDATPFERDLLGELKAACDRNGMKFGLYYSIMDWNHPDYPPRKWEKDRQDEERDWPRYVAYMKEQLAELVERYDPAILWFDGEWEGVWTHEQGIDLYNYVRSLKPDILINNRVDKGRRGMAGMTEGNFMGDFGTPEQQIPPRGFPGVDWESCMTMNRHWGYNRFDRAWKSPEDLVHKLVDIASKGGNFLLNVGPVSNGLFPPKAENRLRGIGEWMWKNGEAIHGTRATVFGEVPWGRVTTRSNPEGMSLYLHVFDWPEDGKLLVPTPPGKVTQVLLYEVGQSLDFELTESGLVIQVPEKPLDNIDTVIRVELTEEEMEEKVGGAVSEG